MLSSIKARFTSALKILGSNPIKFRSFLIRQGSGILKLRQVHTIMSEIAKKEPSVTSNKVYVQHTQGQDMMTISFEYNFDGKSKQFNLYRKAMEPLLSSLERIKLNVGKLSKAKKSKAVDNKSEEAPNLEVYLNGNPIDPKVTKNIDAWIEGAIMELNGKTYHVRRNEPQVVVMKLPTPMMKGFVLLPNVTLENCNIEDCAFTWYRRISAAERDKLINESETNKDLIEFSDKSYWCKLKDGVIYSPIQEDIAHYLKVVCRPSKGTKFGPVYSCISSRPVELGPASCPFEKRHSHTSERSASKDRIRFVTYNILADLYADSDYSRTVLFAHCPAYALEIDYRRQLLLKEIHGYNADIVCLQEVDKKEFTKTYEPFFELVSGHRGVFDTKSGQVSEGVATFFRKDKFELIDSHKTVLSDLIDPSVTVDKDGLDEVDQEPVKNTTDTDGETEKNRDDSKTHPILNDLGSAESKRLMAKFDSIRSKILSHSPLRKRFLARKTILQTSLLKLKGVPSTYVIVANTHLYFAPDADHIRLLQGSVCVRYLEYIKEYYKRTIGAGDTDSRLSIVFCGDMNSSPDCGLFSLLHNGKISSDLPDWSSNKDEAVEGITVETHLRFKSAYQNILYTNYTPEFNGCLDYIYYELDGLECESTVPLPEHAEVTATEGIPSDVFPSDHLALIANLKLIG